MDMQFGVQLDVPLAAPLIKEYKQDISDKKKIEQNLLNSIKDKLKITLIDVQLEKILEIIQYLNSTENSILLSGVTGIGKSTISLILGIYLASQYNTAASNSCIVENRSHHGYTATISYKDSNIINSIIFIHTNNMNGVIISMFKDISYLSDEVLVVNDMNIDVFIKRVTNNTIYSNYIIINERNVNNLTRALSSSGKIFRVAIYDDITSKWYKLYNQVPAFYSIITSSIFDEIYTRQTKYAISSRYSGESYIHEIRNVECNYDINSMVPRYKAYKYVVDSNYSSYIDIIRNLLPRKSYGKLMDSLHSNNIELFVNTITSDDTTEDDKKDVNTVTGIFAYLCAKLYSKLVSYNKVLKFTGENLAKRPWEYLSQSIRVYQKDDILEEKVIDKWYLDIEAIFQETHNSYSKKLSKLKVRLATLTDRIKNLKCCLCCDDEIELYLLSCCCCVICIECYEVMNNKCASCNSLIFEKTKIKPVKGDKLTSKIYNKEEIIHRMLEKKDSKPPSKDEYIKAIIFENLSGTEVKLNIPTLIKGDEYIPLPHGSKRIYLIVTLTQMNITTLSSLFDSKVFKIAQYTSKFKYNNEDIIFILAENAIGVNMQYITDVIIYNIFNSSEVEAQILGRAQRFGRKYSVNIHHLLYKSEVMNTYMTDL